MESDELKMQIDFGLENLDKIFQTIKKFSSDDVEQDLKVSALSYECLGYYNAMLPQKFMDFCLIGKGLKDWLIKY